MECGEGMVAVVRGLRGAGLAVTLMDEGGQFTLVPENYTHTSPRTSRSLAIGSQCAGGAARRESAVQATDGRYTSTYKMMHCHHTPTSPPDQVTEFPPQRAELCPGHGNFIVGGQGSGENFSSPMRSTEFRGGMCWPDRGSVFSPRPSLQPDSFATSLRRYPDVCRDRSSEIVEKLISFTQAKNACKMNRISSPSRLEPNASNQTFCLEPKFSRNTNTEKFKRGYQPEVVVRSKRYEESPTRDTSRRNYDQEAAADSWRRPAASRTGEARWFRDEARPLGLRSASAHPENRPERLNHKERVGSSNGQRNALPQWSTDTVNMEIQATVQVTSRKIMTLPTTVPLQRTIAVPLTPTSSKVEDKLDARDLDTLNINNKQSIHQMEQIIQKKLSLVDMHVQTTSSAIEFSFRRRKTGKNKMRSRSEDKLQIIELMKYRNASVLKQSALKSRSYKSNNKNKSKDVLVEFINNLESKFCCNVPENRKCASDKYHRSIARIYRADVAQWKTVDEDGLREILKSWISLIPLKVKDKIDPQRERKYIQYDLYKYLKRNALIPLKHIRQDKLKSDILNRLKIIPIEAKGDETAVLDRLADILINKITPIGRRKWEVDVNKNKSNLDDWNNSLLKRHNSPSDKEVEDLILNHIEVFLKNTCMKFQESQIRDLTDELLDIFMTSTEQACSFNENYIIRDIAHLLQHYGLTRAEANNFAKTLLENFKRVFVNVSASHEVRSETLIVLPNVCCHGVDDNSNVKVKTETDENIILNLKQYTNELCQQINEWLNDLRIQIPESTEKDLRQEALNDLANDIVERHKYLELNPCNEITIESEIEHLKYQIFKWVNKFIAEDNLEPVHRAPDLMNRIKTIPIPVLSTLRGSCGKDTAPFDQDNTNIPVKTNKISKNDLVVYDDLSYQPEIMRDNRSESKIKTYSDQLRSDEGNIKQFNSMCTSEKCCNKMDVLDTTDLNLETKSNYQLEAEYEQFVKDWVQKIPMDVKDFENQMVLEKAKLGIHNGLWKVVSRLNCDPATYYNRFLYEDLLEDAIDDLLNCLPETSHLKCKRHLLKVEFIEKTISTNDKIKENEEASYKNKLIQSVVSNLRKQGISDNRDENPTKIHEDFQIIKLVDNYLLSKKFKEEDKVTLAIYKKKLLKDLDSFVNDLKKNHTNELKDIDVAAYETDIINVLNNVPLPSEKTLSDEADDVLLGVEIKQWYNDLPIVSNNDYAEQYHRRKQRDILANKIKEIENKNAIDNTEAALKNEVSRFLERTPLQEGEGSNINFMVDELLNRLRNLHCYNQSQNTKIAEIDIPVNYDEFSKNISACSSFTVIPNKSAAIKGGDRNKSEQGSTWDETSIKGSKARSVSNNSTRRMQRNKESISTASTKHTKVSIQEPPSYRMFEEERPHSSSFKEATNEQWFSLQNSRSDAITQTQETNMYTPPPYTDAEKYNESIQRNYESNKFNADLLNTKNSTDGNRHNCCQENTDFVKNYPSTSKNLKTLDHRDQSQNSDITYPKDISKVTEDSKQVITNKDPTFHNCSMECQADKNKQAVDVTKEFSTLYTSSKNTATSTSIDNGSDQSASRQAASLKTQVGDKMKAKLAEKEKDSARRKLNSNSDDEDAGPCHCVERYLKHQQRLKHYPCEESNYFPPCLPIFFPYPYFV